MKLILFTSQRGNWTEPIRFIKKGISIIERSLGTTNPYIITHHQNLGVIYSFKEDFKKSLIYLNKALEDALHTYMGREPYEDRLYIFPSCFSV